MTDSAFLSYDETCNVLREFEDRSGIFDIQMDGWSVWPLFRFKIGAQLCQVRKFGRETKARPKGKLSKLHAALNRNRFDQIASGKDVLFCISEIEMRNRTGSKNCSAIFGSVPARTPRSLSFQLDPSSRTSVPTVFPVHSVNSPYFREKFRSLLPQRRNVQAREKANLLSKRIRRLEDRIGRELKLSETWVYETIENFYRKKKQYRRMLSRNPSAFNPKLLLLSCSYGKEALIAAARENSIAVVEQQHGVIYRGHFGYSYSKASRERFQDYLPVPNFFWSYGAAWIRSLRGMGWWHDNQVRYTGSPAIDIERQRKEDERIPRTCVTNAILTTQGINRLELSKFMENLLRLDGLREKIHLTVRTHPGEDTNYWENWIKNMGVPPRYIHLSNTLLSDVTTAKLLRQADIHLSISSTCHFESVALKTPTVILPLRTSENLGEFRDEQGFYFAQTIAEVAQLIKAPPAVAESASHEVFAPNSEQSMLDEIEELLADHTESEAAVGRL